LNILGQKVAWHDTRWINQALTHRSAGKHNNERLEFLGDSVLSLVISDFLFQTFSQLTEGELSRLRSQLVKGKTLAAVARHYQLGPMIKLGAGEIKSGGVNKSSVLADAVEAVFGAVLMDQGFAQAKQFIESVMQPWLHDIDPQIIKKDPKSELQERLQQRGLQLPSYRLLEAVENNNEIRFKVSCRVDELALQIESTGSSIKKAEQSAANKAIEWLKAQ
jgi:ribonuclease-3